MEFLVAFLLCALGFFIYLANKNNNEVARLKGELEELKGESSPFQTTPNEKAVQADYKPKPKKSTAKKRFVQVIFQKDAKKSYDYFIGNFDVKIGDFVVVHTKDSDSGKIRLVSAKVVYISKPGEVSEYANSKIFKKAKKDKW